MSTSMAPPSSEPPESLGATLSGIPNFLMDPSAAARQVFTRWFWIGPLVLAMIVAVVGNRIVTPIVMHVLQTQPPPAGANPEAYQAQVNNIMRFQSLIAIVAPVFVLLFQAVVLWGASSMVAVNATYRQMLNLAAGCSLISSLGAVAGVIILKSKGEITSMAELRPPMGLDIFLPETTNKVLLALFGYFSLFEIWWIVMMVLVYSAAFRVGKGKAITAIAPLVLISLVFRLVMAALQR